MTREPTSTRPDEPLAEQPAAEQLREFFRGEMPTPWPQMRVEDKPAALRPQLAAPQLAAPPFATKGWKVSKSHLALAASLLLLILGIGVLSQGMRGMWARPADRSSEGAAEKLGPDGLPLRPGQSDPAKPNAKPVSLGLPLPDYGFTE